MYKIAVMGDVASVLGFKALGLDVYPVAGPEEGHETLHRLARENYAIIYMTEQLAAKLTTDIARYKDADPGDHFNSRKGGSPGYRHGQY